MPHADAAIATVATAEPPLSLADALEEAQQRIADLFQHPDDLTGKLAQIKQRFTAEKASVDATLKTSVQQQLDDTHNGLRLLRSAADSLVTIQGHFGAIDSGCLDQRGAIANYPKIKRVSRTHQNFTATCEVVRQFQALNVDIERIATLLDQDCEDPMRDGSPNLLRIHHQLFRLESFREQTLHKARQQGPSVTLIVTKYFKRLDSTAERFREHLWSLSRQLLDFVRADHGALIVRLLKIIEREEREDEHVLLLLTQQQQQLLVDADDVVNSNSYSNNNNNGNESQPPPPQQQPRTIKNYRSQLFNAIHTAIEQKFQQLTAPHQDDVVASLDAVHFVFDDLALVFDELAVRFPPRYEIFSFHVIQYHKRVYDMLNRLTQTPQRRLETRDILKLTTWVREYYRLMADRFGVGEELLEPRLLDDNEANLIADYVRLIRQKLMEWVGRLLDTEMVEFLTRDKPPDTEDQNIYCTAAAVILFQMLNQQVDIAIEAARGGRLLLDVARECFEIACHFSRQQVQMLEAEQAKFDQNDTNFQPGFPEYVMALANNHFKCSEFCDLLQKRLDAQLDAQFRDEFNQFAGQALDVYSKSSKRATQTLLHIVFRDVAPVFQQVLSASWYEGAGGVDNCSDKLTLIIGTLDDYFKDFKLHLHDYLFSKFTTDCMDRFLMAYLEAFRGGNKSSVQKFRLPQACARIRGDVAVSVQFWSQHKSPKRVKQAFDVVDKVVGLLECSESMIFLSWYSLWKAYSDVPMAFVEELLLRREDLTKAAVKEAMANCRAKAKEGIAEATPSIFAKMFPADSSNK